MGRSSHLVRLAAVCVAAALAFAAAALGARKVECLGNICVADNGGISPSKLPRHGSAPITARLIGEISTRDGSHPPALRSVDLDVDRTIEVHAAGLPICKPRAIEAVTTAEARRVCGPALVGSGEAEVEVAFPESTPFSARGPVLLFNGGIHGASTLVLLHAYVSVPVPTAIVTTASVKRIHEGRFGLEIAAKIPPIAGAAGSVTKFELKVGRRFTYRGQRKSFLTASCPTGSWVTKGEVLFSDGTRAGLTHVFPCTPQG